MIITLIVLGAKLKRRNGKGVRLPMKRYTRSWVGSMGADHKLVDQARAAHAAFGGCSAFRKRFRSTEIAAKPQVGSITYNPVFFSKYIM